MNWRFWEWSIGSATLGGANVQTILERLDHMSAQLDDLIAAVAAEHDTTASAITLLNGLAAKVDELVASGADATQLQALADSIRADTAALADAVTTDARP